MRNSHRVIAAISSILILISHAWGLTRAERISLMGFCKLAEEEAKSDVQLIPYALKCLFEEGKIKEGNHLLSRLRGTDLASVVPYILMRTAMDAESIEPSSFLSEDERALIELKKRLENLFFSQRYTEFFEEFFNNPKAHNLYWARRFLALAYYRIGNYALSLAVLDSFNDTFGAFWRWKMKRRLGLDLRNDEEFLKGAAYNDFYADLYRLMTESSHPLPFPIVKDENRCPEAVLLQRSGMDDVSLEALKECSIRDPLWYRVIPLLPNPYPAIRLLYATKVPRSASLLYSYPKPYLAYVRLASWAYGVDEDLAYALMRQESLFDRRALSSSSAMGLMQIIPTTATWISDTLGEFSHLPKYALPFFSIKYGVWYLGYLERSFPGFLKVAAYNSGPARLASWLSENSWVEDISDVAEFYPVAQTRTYIKRVLVNFYIYRFLLYTKASTSATAR